MFGEQITMGQAVIVCVFSLAVVFLVLLAISYLIDLTAWIVRKMEKKQEQKPAAPAAPTPSAPPAAHDDTVDTVLITAAVAACLGKSTSEFVVRSIRRVANTETPWSQLGRTDSIQ